MACGDNVDWNAAMLAQRGNHKRTSKPSSSVVVAGHVDGNLIARTEGASGVAPARQANSARLSSFHWRHAPEIRVIGALLFLSLLFLGVLIVGSGALTGDAIVFDWAIVLALRNPLNITDPLGPDWFEIHHRRPGLPRQRDGSGRDRTGCHGILSVGAQARPRHSRVRGS